MNVVLAKDTLLVGLSNIHNHGIITIFCPDAGALHPARDVLHHRDKSNVGAVLPNLAHGFFGANELTAGGAIMDPQFGEDVICIVGVGIDVLMMFG